MRSTFFLLLLLITGVANATDYYVSASGNDSNNGTSQTTPWKTISKVESFCNNGSIHPGDRILFKCGDQFTGKAVIAGIWGNDAPSGTATSPITLGNYGTGAKPVFLYPTGGSTAAESRVLFWFAGIDYWVIDGLNFTDLDVTNNKVTPANLGIPLYLGSDVGCNHWTIQNVDISLCGMGVVLVGDYNLVQNCNMTNFKNLKSTSGGYEDYGANPFTLLDGNYNTIKNNYVTGGWSESLDFGFNGGFCEMFGSCSNNTFMYNTIIDCNGLSEFGANGASANSVNNLYAYNKLIDNGAMFYCNISGPFACQVGNTQFYNNTVVETNNSRFAQGSANAGAGVTSPEAISHLNVDSYMFLYNGSPTASTVFALKNNIFNIANPLKICRSGEARLTHDYQVFKLSGGSTFPLTLASHEVSTSAVVFNNTTASNATSWDLTLPSSSPAIDKGTNVGITKDFIGTTVPAVPNAGIYETITGASNLAAASTATAISCNGGTSTVTVTATGGTAPYTGTGTFTVSAGSYTYTVTDAAGTSKTTSITVTQPTAITATLTAGTITVNGGTTTLTVSASGGTSGYTYKLNSGSYQSSATFTSVAAGTHTVTIKDANGCTTTKTITITQPAATDPLTASAVSSGAILCNGGTTTITVSATGGTAPYTGTGTFTVGAGTYTYTVTDAAGGTATTSVTLSQPTALNLTLTAGTITVNGGVTNITASATGGTGSLSYMLNNSGTYQSSSMFPGVAAGTHTVTVKDKNACTSTKTIVITQPGASNPVVVTSTIGTAIACNGGTTTVTVSATGGTSPYTGTGTFTVGAGTYNYTVTDAAGATGTTSVTVSQPTALSLTVTAGTITVNGGTTTVTATSTGGSGSNTFKLDNGSFQSSGSFTGVAAGTHTVTVRDKNSCTATQTITITQPNAPSTLAVTATAGTISCNGGTATVTVSATGGTTPYTGTGTFTASAGTRTFTVTDAAGTVKTATITITQPTAIVPTITAGTITVAGGTTTVTAGATGGTAPYTYKLNSGSYQSSTSFLSIVAGTYTLTVKDANGCTATTSTTITQPSSGVFKLNLVSKSNESCKGKKDGKITVQCTGGTAPYQYRINYGAYSSNNVFTNLRPGFYIITGKSATGATSTIYVYIAASNTRCTSGKAEEENLITDSKPTGEGSLQINVYPNPTTTEFSLVIEKGSQEDARIFVTNVNGQPVYEGRGKSFDKINFGRNFTSGIYFVKVVQGKTVQTKKIIKIN
ncbi:MAG: T9SS type A sorting domain-containing protein [Ferruginibacter sp.]